MSQLIMITMFLKVKTVKRQNKVKYFDATCMFTADIVALNLESIIFFILDLIIIIKCESLAIFKISSNKRRSLT